MPKDRLKDQDTDGVEAEVLYSQSTFGVFGGLFYGLTDAETRVAAFPAPNDTLADWINAAADRLIPVGIIPVADPAEGVAELERLAGDGLQSSHHPHLLGHP